MEHGCAEADLAAEAYPAQAEARLPRADGDAWWTRRDPTPSRARALTTRGLAVPRAQSGVAVAADRLRRSTEITRALRRGKRARRRLVQIAAHPNGLPRSRYALSVSRRVGSAVARNRVKRRLRAMLRTGAPGGGYDLVVTARPGSASAEYRELRDDVARCFSGIGLRLSEDP